MRRAMTPFADRAIAAIRARNTPLCVGLDPFADKLPALFASADPIASWRDFFSEIIALTAQRAAAIKPQLGLFEAFGPAGYALCLELCAQARAAGLLVLLDAKRGDIGTTAEGYATAAFDRFEADAVTVNPYMGLDTLAPFIAQAEAKARGVIVLVRTSNPGAVDLQDLDAGGAPVWVRLAEKLAPLQAALRGASGYSGLMAVIGATWPQEAQRLRAVLGESLFLVPGYGAQGAGASDAIAGFARRPGGQREGGFVNASRAVLYPPAAAAADNIAAWRAAISAALDDAAGDLAAACA
jgi:orotidine-5'-phosphate decarboxylase